MVVMSVLVLYLLITDISELNYKECNFFPPMSGIKLCFHILHAQSHFTSGLAPCAQSVFCRPILKSSFTFINFVWLKVFI